MNNKSPLLKALLTPTPALVWGKAHYLDPVNERAGFRSDDCGNRIQLEQYGNRDSLYGWEFDHIVPRSKGGADDITNIRPLHWKANVAKADASPSALASALLGK